VRTEIKGAQAIASRFRADWTHPTHIRFGAGRAAELPEACRQLGMRRPLLVTDPVLARRPACGALLKANAAAGIFTDLFSGIGPEPDREQIGDGASVFAAGAYDGIIAAGGGSSLDAGKAIALASVAGPDCIWSFGFCAGKAPPEIAQGPLPPIIAVPTTAGTGSEVNGSAVITDARRRVKRSLYHPSLLPAIVIADPSLTRAPDPALTAATGMDALSHNLEALCAPGFYPMLDAIALQGLRFAKEWLPAAFGAPRSIEARVYTMAASIMGAVAFEKGLGAMHAMAHAVGALCKTHHGRTISVVMPYVLRFNRRRIRSQTAATARFLGLPGHDTSAVIDWILSLRRTLGLPGTLVDLGVRPADIPVLVERTLADANAPTNPVPLDKRGAERLFGWAMRGSL